MSHFAKVEHGVVTDVTVAEQEFIDSGAIGDPLLWIQTSYNTHGGTHSNSGTPLRKNYAGIGYAYDLVRDAFYVPQPYPSWVLNEDTCLWGPPIPYPNDADFQHIWDEPTLSWVLTP